MQFAYPKDDAAAEFCRRMRGIAGGRLGFGTFVDVAELAVESATDAVAVELLELWRKLMIEEPGEAGSVWTDVMRNVLTKDMEEEFMALTFTEK